MSTFFENTLKIVEDAAHIAKIPGDILSRLKKPDHVFEFEIAVPAAAGGEKLKFQAWRVQYNNILGPYKGGIRFHPESNKDEVMALSLLMTIKNAIVGIPYGGGKGAVKVNTRSLSPENLEALSREYVRNLFPDIGPDKDIPAPDVGTTPEIMAWMADEYSKLAGHWEPAAFTGKPIEKGGSQGREVATAFGGFIVLREYLQATSYKLQASPTVAIQGFGNVGGNLASILQKGDFNVVGLSDSKGAIYNPDGLNVEELMRIQKERGLLDKEKCSLEEAAGGKCRVISNQELLELDVDVLIPSALENQITAVNARKIKAKVILEMANGPTTEEADVILAGRGIEVIPDILVNGGGVVGSYFEWLQSKERKWWDEPTVLKKIEEVMMKAFIEVKKTKQDLNLPWRKAAYVKALQRIAEAMKKPPQAV
ncbi:MAG: Glu/Leu/Phe/Val dehydrogenase [Candidatus Sungiibacteriota bacterium]